MNTHISLKHAHSSLKGLSDKLSRYLSPQIYQSIFEGKQDASIGSSRKKLSVFFSDIVGFTRKTDGMEPEDLSYILNSYLNRMAEVVISHGGTLDKFIGDAILTFFGDPETRGPQGDALACLNMATEMREAVAVLNKEWEHLAIPTGFQIWMGITAGYCTVGNFGSEQRMDYAIIGNQVNLASRLESVSQPGELRIAHETWLLVRDHYDCTPQDPILVKGFERPVQTYIVNGPRSADSQNGRIEESCDGFSLALDPEQVDPEDREAVLARLQSAIDQMR